MKVCPKCFFEYEENLEQCPRCANSQMNVSAQPQGMPQMNMPVQPQGMPQMNVPVQPQGQFQMNGGVYPQAGPQMYMGNNQMNGEMPQSPKKKKGLIIAIILVVLAILGGVLFFVFSKKDKNSNKENTSKIESSKETETQEELETQTEVESEIEEESEVEEETQPEDEDPFAGMSRDEFLENSKEEYVNWLNDKYGYSYELDEFVFEKSEKKEYFTVTITDENGETPEWAVDPVVYGYDVTLSSNSDFCGKIWFDIDDGTEKDESDTYSAIDNGIKGDDYKYIGRTFYDNVQVDDIVEASYDAFVQLFDDVPNGDMLLISNYAYSGSMVFSNYYESDCDFIEYMTEETKNTEKFTTVYDYSGPVKRNIFAIITFQIYAEDQTQADLIASEEFTEKLNMFEDFGFDIDGYVLDETGFEKAYEVGTDFTSEDVVDHVYVYLYKLDFLGSYANDMEAYKLWYHLAELE